MPFMAWDDDLATGIREVDDQHKRLLDLVNRLNDAVVEGDEEDILEQTLSELVDYTIYHFNTEERLMSAAAYPEYVSHQACHDALTKKVLEARRRMRSGESAIHIEILEYLRNWLLNHIKVTDKKVGRYLREQDIV